MSKKQFYLLIVTICLIGVVFAAIILQQTTSFNRRLLKENFSQRTQNFLFSIEENYFKNQIVLNAVNGFFAASTHVNNIEWNSFCEALKLEKRFPSIKWLAVLKNLPEDQREAFTKEFRLKENPTFNLWPEHTSAIHYPFIYVYPPYYNNLIGFDPQERTQLEKSLKKALECNALISAPAIFLNPIDETPSERLWILPTRTQASNKNFGWITATLNFATMIEEVSQKTFLSNINIEVYAGSNEDGNQLIFSRILEPNHIPLISETLTLNFASQDWTFTFSSSPEYEALISFSAPILIFFLILALTISLSMYLFFRLKHLLNVARESMEDNHFERIVKEIPYPIIAVDNEGTITTFNHAAEKALEFNASEVVGKKALEVLQSPNTLDNLSKTIAEKHQIVLPLNQDFYVNLTQKTAPENVEWNWLRKDKVPFNCRLYVRALLDQEEKQMGFLLFCQDTSQFQRKGLDATLVNNIRKALERMAALQLSEEDKKLAQLGNESLAKL